MALQVWKPKVSLCQTTAIFIQIYKSELWNERNERKLKKIRIIAKYDSQMNVKRVKAEYCFVLFWIGSHTIAKRKRKAKE